MGLDQYAFTPDRSENPEFIWRKHAKLQTFMEELYYERAGDNAESFNCVDLALSEDDIKALEALVTGNELPTSEGGFFFGHQWQDESAQEYKEQDLRFCKWAAAVLETLTNRRSLETGRNSVSKWNWIYTAHSPYEPAHIR